MFRFSTIALAAIMASPALWQAFVTESLDPTDALIRFLIAVPIAAVLLAIPRTVINYYRRHRPLPTLIQADANRTDRPAETPTP
ncbi:MAG TPA: hypothetical protein VFV67_26600 [Actinophytocola sp.]|uniref:hypothetical protein n=1 Tax=Actinophytocola sp. TaxID=1872138 RepID=UPI002DBD94D3|nr:hypothetical protein [Actinophytocola sp.]HEU5474233.1 hypothetical protein [Actinophytocola sp.]